MSRPQNKQKCQMELHFLIPFNVYVATTENLTRTTYHQFWSFTFVSLQFKPESQELLALDGLIVQDNMIHNSLLSCRPTPVQ